MHLEVRETILDTWGKTAIIPTECKIRRGFVQQLARVGSRHPDFQGISEPDPTRSRSTRRTLSPRL